MSEIIKTLIFWAIIVETFAVPLTVAVPLTAGWVVLALKSLALNAAAEKALSKDKK